MTTRAPIFASTLALGVVAIFVSCGAGDEGPRADTVARTDAGDERPAYRPPVPLPPGTPDIPYPQDLPPGWTVFSDYDPYCGFFIPNEKKSLPPPIEWEPCETKSGDAGLPGPDGIVCKRMVQNWTPHANGQHTTSWVRPVRGSDGALALHFDRLVGKSAYAVTADVDGPVRTALFEAGPCTTLINDANGGNVLYRVRENPDDLQNPRGGLFGGSIDSLKPRVYLPKGYSVVPKLAPGFYVGERAFVENIGGDKMYSLATGAVLMNIPHPPEDNDLFYTLYQFHEDDLFWIADSSARTLIKAWTAAGGTKTLIGYPSDSTRAVDAFGTDGVDMAWIEASGRLPGAKIFSTYETWTAKYSTDPAVVTATKRRLRSEYPGSMIEINAVGCGYAAHAIFTNGTWGRGFRLIRLSDGVSWEVVSESEQQRLQFNVYKPIAITCDEVFATANTLSHAEIVRIRIDSLGPGLAPD